MPRTRGGSPYLLWIAIALIAVGGLLWCFWWPLHDWIFGRQSDEQVLVLIITKPKNAKVFLDNEPVASMPVALPRQDRKYIVRVEAKGYRPKIFTIVADQTQTHRINLGAGGGRGGGGSSGRGGRGARGSGGSAGARDCPPGMKQVVDRKREHRFCIDRYEFPGKGQVPLHGVSLARARSSCAHRGTRLCKVEEWVAACGGRYPYGSRYDPMRCNTGSQVVRPAGAQKGCRSRFGVYDLSGNVSEWVEDGVTLGGDASAEKGMATCRTSSVKGGPMTGFRCCADAR